MCLRVAPESPTMRQPHLITIPDRPLHHLWHKILWQPPATPHISPHKYWLPLSPSTCSCKLALHYCDPTYTAVPYQRALWSPAPHILVWSRRKKEKSRPVFESFPQEREGRAMSYMITSCVTLLHSTQSCQCASELLRAKWAAADVWWLQSHRAAAYLTWLANVC